ncbi:MAG: M48 family metalloprotease [Chloroflexi bacterium]|nr:M48 family metalloprotease [Chloroflexota bacterium]
MLKRSRFLGIPVAAVLLLAACLSTNLAPIGSTARFTPEDDERQLWQALRRAEEKVLPPKAVYDEAGLEQYLTEIVRRVTPPSYTEAGGLPIKVKVRKDPRLNAGAMAHGLIIVHTGLISRAQDEGELAGVLAHEVGHITRRHQIRKRREMQNQQTAINVASFVATLALAAAAVDQSARGHHGTAYAISRVGQPLLALGLNLTYSAMVSGYSRDMEREADEEAVKTMAAAGYSPRQFAQMFRHMLAESPDRGPIETFFWGSHPRTTERIETVEQAAARFAGPEKTNKAVFERNTARVRLANAQWDAYFGRWRLATAQVERVKAFAPPSERDSLGVLWQGQMHAAASVGARSRNDEGEADRNFAAAVDRFTTLTGSTAANQRAAGYRGLGEVYFAHREHKATHCSAKDAFSKYLELRPTAKDADLVKRRMAELRC